MDQEFLPTLCLPEFLKCSFLTNPLFWLVLLLALLLYFICLNSFTFIIREAKCSNTQWPPYLMWFQNEQNIAWLWPIIVAFFVFLPTVLLMLSKTHSYQIKKCLMIGYILFILFFILMSFSLRYAMYPVALTAIITPIIILLWMMWLSVVIFNGKQNFTSIYGVISYFMLIILCILLSIVIGKESNMGSEPYVCPNPNVNGANGMNGMNGMNN
jgi:hypothetical protein